MLEEVPVTIYDQLAWLYLNEPDANTLNALNSAFPGLRLREADLPAVQQDYHDLFCVPVSGRYLPPFESAQRANRLWGPITHHVADWYLASGFNPASLHTSQVWRMQVIPDHIGYELAFYGALLAGDAEAANRFWRGHLGAWGANYAVQVAEKAATSLYQVLGELTAKAVDNG